MAHRIKDEGSWMKVVKGYKLPVTRQILVGGVMPGVMTRADTATWCI